MAKLTREQAKKWNEQAKNGFQFDIEYYLIWGEKTLTKKIKMENGDVIEFKIEYNKEFETKTNGYGCKWNVETGRYIPMLYITHWKPSSSGCYHSSGWEKIETLGSPENSKKYNVLCKFSETVNTDEYMEEFKKNIA